MFAKRRSSAISKSYDLKWVLVRRIMLATAVCVLVGATIVLAKVASDARARNEAAAQMVSSNLQLQKVRSDTAPGLPQRFPDWSTVVDFSLVAGQCAKFIQTDGKTLSHCVGSGRETAQVPSWFLRIFSWFSGSTNIETRFSNGGNKEGTIEISIAPAAVAHKAWSSVSEMLQLSAALLLIMCGLVYAVVDRALRPAGQILKGLARLEDGDLTARLPKFQLRELDSISDGFNSLAKQLQTTKQERSEFARRLIDAQETERTNIARELHDDVAQQLSAMSGLAAALQASLKEDASHLEPSARDLAASARTAMKSLRHTMTHLRPPEIDEVGLMASLEGLISDHNRRAGSGMTFEFKPEYEIADLSADAAGHVYRIVQEGLNNAARHSSASKVTVRLSKQCEPCASQAVSSEFIELNIEDNGNGWPHHGPNGKEGRLGLLGMRERVSALGGDLAMRNSNMGGASVHVRFRLPAGVE